MNQIKNKNSVFCVPTQKLRFSPNNNNIYVRRDDLYPIAFGGNKARKAELFFEEILKNGCDTVVTYGSSSSNHCRAVACLASQHGIDCLIVSPKEQNHVTSNKSLNEIFGAKTIECSVSDVSRVIDEMLENLRSNDKKPYFIYGGGHGNIGTQAYLNVFNEIVEFEKNNDIVFDKIFFASGTGTTQAGLVAGAIKNNRNINVVGISIARRLPRGKDVVLDSLKEFLGIDVNSDLVEFVDEYIGEGYGSYNDAQLQLMKKILKEEGLPLDHTYTGKAFYGMTEYLKKNSIKNKNILFIHTGGTPLFYDDLEKLK